MLTILQIAMKATVAQSTPSILNRHHTQCPKTQRLKKNRSDRTHGDGTIQGGRWEKVCMRDTR